MTTDTPLQLLRWQALDADDQARVRGLAILPQQIEFAGTVDRAIAACEAAAPEAVAGLAIVRQGRPVGFVVLSRGAAVPAWAPATSVALTAMRIDASLQGQGLGRAALLAVEGWLRTHWPEATAVALCVDDENLAGRRAYAQAGYVEYAEPRQGRIGLVRYLHKPLAAMGQVVGQGGDAAGPLGSEVRQFAQRSVLCWLATADAQGQPNVSPKEIFAVADAQHLVIAHIASPTSVRNIAANAHVCVSFVDVFVQKGFKLSGTARVVPQGHAEFAHWAAPLLPLAGPRFAVHAVLVVRVAEVAPILAPSYRLYPDQTTEQGQIEAAMQRYGVRPAAADGALDGSPADWRAAWPSTMNALHTACCTLEPLLASHATEMFAVLSDPAIYEFENAPPASVDALHARYVRQQRRGPETGGQLWLNWVIRLNAGPGAGPLVGYVQATVLPDGHALVAYELNSLHWRQGIGTAALQAMLDELALAHGVHRFVAVLKRRNFRSAGLLHKLGFEPADAKLDARFRDEADELVMTRLATAGLR